MALKISKAKSGSDWSYSWMFYFATMFGILLLAGCSIPKTVEQQTFSSPEGAVEALVEALKAEDQKPLETIFGSGSDDILSSGDPVADQSEREKFLELYYEKNRLEQTGDKTFLSIGNIDWPFSVPMVKKEGVWLFDTEAGIKEVQARRIGRNELSTVQVCLAYVDAQREYALRASESVGLLQYAQKLRSDEGKKNGLYWETSEGEEPSPLGPLFALADEQGYSVEEGEDKPEPYFGYYYQILTGQGKDAPDGAYSYMVRGKMIGGFAMVAYPAKYASSGVMTFIVNHSGVVYQKDQGLDTVELALVMEMFNPDSTWSKVE